MKNFHKIAVDAGRYKSRKKGKNCGKVDDFDNMPERAPIRPRRNYRDQRDYLSPLIRWLNSQVGRPWDNITSDLYKSHPKRSIDRHHIMVQHVSGIVIEEERIEMREGRPYVRFNFSGFYLLQSGCLYVWNGILFRVEPRKASDKNLDMYLTKEGVYTCEDGRKFKVKNANPKNFNIADNVMILYRERYTNTPWIAKRTTYQEYTKLSSSQKFTCVIGPFDAYYD